MKTRKQKLKRIFSNPILRICGKVFIYSVWAVVFPISYILVQMGKLERLGHKIAGYFGLDSWGW